MRGPGFDPPVDPLDQMVEKGSDLVLGLTSSWAGITAAGSGPTQNEV